MSAKAEIANYRISTSFGGHKPYAIDLPIARPTTKAQAIEHIEAIYAENDWDAAEQRRNHLSLNLPDKSLSDYANDELKVILADMEKCGMILYQKTEF